VRRAAWIALAPAVIALGAAAGDAVRPHVAAPVRVAAPAPAVAPPARKVAAPTRLLLGHSARGRAIFATRAGDPAAPVRVLVVGDVHGNEPAGEAIVARLRRARLDGVVLYLVRTGNPDGRALGTRQNARGVDLNRNFPWRWRPGAPGTYYPGPKAASEPETRALMRLVRQVRPQLAIYYHQHLGITVRERGIDQAVQREYARRTGLPLRATPDYRGTAVQWENHLVSDGSAFVVELRAGPADAALHADTVLALARRYRGSP
jgi:protein MpaA